VWWAAIFRAAAARGDAVFTTTPEFGPKAYAWSDAHTGETYNNIWDVRLPRRAPVAHATATLQPHYPNPTICPRPKTKQVNHFIAARMAALWKATVGEGAATVVPDADKGVWADVHA
jgi:hypothetical protein